MTASTEGETPSMETQNPSKGSAADLPMSTQESDTPLEPNPSTQQHPDATLQPTKGSETGQKRKREDENPKTANGSDPDPKSSGSVHPLYKTSLCSYFRRHSASCSHGETCRFAHSEEELQPRPDGSWDPTSERAKKLLKRETEDKDEEGEAQEEEESVMMTEVLAESGDPQLSKCLIHLPRKWSSDQLKTFLDEQGVTFKAAKKKKGMVVGFITFEAAEHVKSTTEVLEGKTFGNKKLKVEDVVPRSYDDKIKSAQKKYRTVESGAVDPAEASAVLSDHGNTDSSGSNGKSARDVVTPLAHMPYTEQLEQKKNSLLQLLKRLTRNARKACPKGVSLPEWVVKSREIGGLPCELEGIIESPLINGYRNKCEFSVGYSVQGKPTVGFMLGNFREGVTAVEEPVDCPNVSMTACKYALIFQEFLQNSALPIWNRFNNTGFWRQLTVREGRRPQEDTNGQSDETNIAEVMLMVQVCTTGYDGDVINSEIERMTQAFAAGAASTSPLPLTAFLLQDHRGISNAAPADAPLRSLPVAITQANSESEVVKTFNETRIHDYIGNLRFSISPTAFFQVNTLAAEKLYSLAGDWARLGPDTLLFDVCCGTGTIGLTLANRVGMVVGIEMNASAVSDAQRNAEINGIENCKFVCAKAEDVMGSLLKEYLDTPQQQDEDSNSSANDEKQNEEADNDTISVDNESDPQKCLEGESTEADHSHVSNKSTEDEQNNGRSSTVDGCSTMGQRFKNIVAIVDPPRSGLHPIVIKALRTHPRLRRLVYISCNPETLVANAIELCTPSAEKTEKRSNRGQGWRNMSNAGLARQRLKSMPKSEPFRPVKAMAVDLFPHTPHCELVMLLERLLRA